MDSNTVPEKKRKKTTPSLPNMTPEEREKHEASLLLHKEKKDAQTAFNSAQNAAKKLADKTKNNMTEAIAMATSIEGMG